MAHKIERLWIEGPAGAMKLLVLGQREDGGHPGVLWIHGGGYRSGMPEMAFFSRAADLVRYFHAVVVTPEYRLSGTAPYPAALDDCYAALLWLKEHAAELGVRSDQIMVGGESAGGGLTAALCMLARDRGEVNIAFQMPLYPMLDDRDTPSSRDNHAPVWNTAKNHSAWAKYLAGQDREHLSPYASPARQTDYRKLPPCYTFVGDAEPFYDETLRFVENLRAAGVEAELDVFPGQFHAFDMFRPHSEAGVEAKASFLRHFEHAMNHYFAENGTSAGDELKPGLYRHFKGKEYRLLFVARHSETEEEMVVYQAQYGERGYWVRPAAMWNETVERDGVKMKRFTYIGP